MRKISTKTENAQKIGKDVSVVIDVTEDFFRDLPPDILLQRTRDHRYYRQRFGATGFRINSRKPRCLTTDEVEKIASGSDFLTLAWFLFYGDRDFILWKLRPQIDRLNKIARHHPRVLAIQCLIELDVHIYRDFPPAATPQEALENYQRMAYEYAAGGINAAERNGECRARVKELLAREKNPSLRQLMNTIYEVELDPAIEIGTFPMKVFSVHPHFAWGADFIHLERGHWSGNAQIAISFLRGGAREFGRKWAMDMDPWQGSHTYGRGPTTYDADGRHVAGGTAELQWFNWLATMLAGAHAVVNQGPEYTFFRFPHPTLFGPSNCDIGELVNNEYGRVSDPGEWGAPLSPVGEYAERLARLVNEPSFDRGRPIVPVALMMELWHGWETHMFACEDWAWAGKVPVHRGDRMLSELFDVIYPGYIRSGRMGDSTYNPDVPWSSEHEMMEMLYHGLDMRPYEDGTFVPSPFGDSFDVVTDQVKADILREYSMVILAGRLSLTPENLPRLRAYVEGGGTLVLHGMGLGLWEGGRAIKVPPGYRQEVESLIGCKIKEWYGLGMFSSIWCETGERFREGKYEYTVVEMKEAKPLMKGDDEKQPSLVTANRVGAGRVIFCAPHHHLTAQGKKMVVGVRKALGRLITPMVPARIEGRPIQFHVTRIQDGYLVGLFNWSKIPWIGRVEMLRMKGAIKQVGELLEKRQPPLGPSVAGNSFSAAVEPYGICLYRVRGDA